MLSLISLPNNFVASTTGVASELISDLSPYITLIVGILLGILILEVVIGIIRVRKAIKEEPF